MLLNDRYEIRDKIGEGATAIVYCGWDCHIKRQVAVKRLKSGKAEEIKMFRQEADYIKRLRHPMIPVVFDLFEQDEAWYLVMEYVEGTDLKSYIMRNGPMEEGKVCDRAIQLLQCLAYLHNRKPPVIYCDLKPDNIIVCTDGTWKLIDWGAALAMRYGEHSVRRIAGTRGYAAPEQTGETEMNCLKADARSDLYAFGKTLYYIVTGADPAKPPYGELPAHCYAPAICGDLERIINICTEKDPAARYQSAQEAIRAFEEAGKGKKIWKGREFIRKVEKQVWLTEQKEECTFYRESCIM